MLSHGLLRGLAENTPDEQRGPTTDKQTGS